MMRTHEERNDCVGRWQAAIARSYERPDVFRTEGTKPGNGEVILGEADIGPTQQTETSAPEDCSESRFRSKDSAFREATEGPEQGGDGPMVDE